VLVIADKAINTHEKVRDLKIPGMQSFIECGCYHKDAEKSNLING
jgi:hypothetical protein